MVKCAECGLLTSKGFYSGQTPEINARQRQPDALGRLHNYRSESKRGPHYDDTYPLCFVRAADLQAEAFAANEVARLGEGEFVNPVHVERDCDRWMPWTPGFLPKEHLEWGRMLELHRMSVESDERLTKMQLEAEERLTKMQVDVSTALLKVQTESHTEGSRVARVALGIAVVSLIVAGAGAMAEVLSVLVELARPRP